METVDLLANRELLKTISVELNAVKQASEDLDSEHLHLLNSIREVKEEQFDHKNFVDTFFAFKSALFYLECRLETLTKLLSAKKVPLSDDTYGAQFEGEDFWHRHSRRYLFMYAFGRDNENWETQESEPRCERVYADGRVEPNPACRWIGLKGDEELLSEIAKAQLRYEKETRQAEELRRDWEYIKQQIRLLTALRADEARLAAVQRAMPSVRGRILDGLQKLFSEHGEFLSHEQSIVHIDSWLARNTNSEIDPQPCLDELERMAIVRHSNRLLDGLANATTDTCRSILRERISGNRPLTELRKVFQEIQCLVETQPEPEMSAEEAIEAAHRLQDWLDQFNRNCDETIADEVQRDLTKERFYNSEFVPAMQELTKRGAGL